jgi:proteasome regulatory subunit
MEKTEKAKPEEVNFGYEAERTELEEENKILKETVEHLKDELNRLRTAPLIVAEVKELVNDHAIVRLTNGNEFYVNILKECPKIKPGDFVLCEQKNLTIIDLASTSKSFNVEKFVLIDKPKTKFTEIGGLHKQIEEIKEVVELPLLRPDLFEKTGISPPKGILLYGPPGTGKTLLARAVAASTNSTFIEIVASELVQKFIGEGAKLVKEIFELAREKAPSVIFIDEIDALAAKRIEIGTSGEREVQRTLMQLLAEIDGFKPLGNVKIIGATNRRDILDPAIIRPGRLDRLIKIDTPTEEERLEILQIHSKNMKLDKVDLKKAVKEMEEFSGAEIRASCTEAGYRAIRANRFKVTQKDFTQGIKRVKEEEKDEGEDYLGMFG